MTDATINSSRVRDAGAGLLAQLGMMLRAFRRSPVRVNFALLALGLFAVILATAYGQIKLNEWNQPFYDALARRDLPDFLEQLLRFGVIAGGLLALNVLQMWLNLSVKVKLRQGLMHDLIDAWMMPGRAFRLANAGSIGTNPDQRLHEDARHLTELTADLGIGLLQASILLFTFVSVLWSLSSGLRVPHRQDQSGYSRLHGLGSAPLCGVGLPAELCGGTSPDQPERGTLCP